MRPEIPREDDEMQPASLIVRLNAHSLVLCDTCQFGTHLFILCDK